jgi:hypothetical protein
MDSEKSMILFNKCIFIKFIFIKFIFNNLYTKNEKIRRHSGP